LKRILSLLMIPLLIMSLTGCGTNYSSAVLFSGQTKWFGSKLLPDYEPVIPLDDIIPDSSIQNEPVDDFPTAMEPELPVEPAPSETAIPELPSSSEEESSEGIIAPEILPGTPAAPQPEPSSDTLVRVQDYIPEIRQALAYADTNNFTRQRIYDFSDAYLRYGTVKKLAAVCDELATLDLGILIWDAFRPLESQKKLWELCPDETYVSHPVTGTLSHCRGNTLDVTLVDLRTGEAKPIPTEYDNFTDLADRNYTDCAPEGALYAVILEDIMKKHGFEPYFEEWWHFTDTDDYPVEEIFHPTVPTIWTAICSKSMSMVKAPYSESVVSKIRTGEKLELLGWNDKYARVSYNGKTGYVMSCDIKPASENYFSTVLDVVVPTDTYTYDQMFADLEILHTLYPV